MTGADLIAKILHTEGVDFMGVIPFNSLEEAGAKVERIVAVIDRAEGGREKIEQAGYAFESILTKGDLSIT